MTKERSTLCPICDTPTIFQLPTGDAREVRCPTCGTYTITGTGEAIIKDFENLHILSGVLRAKWENGGTTKVTDGNIQKLINSAPKLNSSDKIDRILAYLDKKSDAAGDYIDLDVENDYPIAFAKHAQEFEHLLKQAILEDKYVEERDVIHKGTHKCRLTRNGEKRLTEIKGQEAENKDKRELVQSPPSLEVFVNQARIDELKAIASPKFDLIRLIKLCEELNICYGNECYIAVAALTRTIMNHVPPIFGQGNFSGVASNYGGQSFKKSMQNLENSAKNISDRHLHEQIDTTVALPNKTQVNFSQDFDVLLEKVVQELK